MPSGYTADLHAGKEVPFPEFAMNCARAFGPLITIRDEPLDKPIPKSLFQPDSYHRDALKAAKRCLSEVKRWSKAKAEEEAKRAHRRSLRRNRTVVREAQSRRQRYKAVLTKVKAWTPPTAGHKGLKKFMVQQLQESIKRDCSYQSEPTKRLTGEKYKRSLIKEAEQEIKYHTKEHKAEVRQVKKITRWVNALRKSLANSR